MSLLMCVTRAANELRFIPTELEGVKESLQLYTKPHLRCSLNRQERVILELGHVIEPQWVLGRWSLSVVF